MTKILVLDNYDSFVYTLSGYLQQLGATTDVVRNDAVSAKELPELMKKYDGVLISPGPGTPKDAGLSINVVQIALETNQSVFGVCLGHQAIGEAFGGQLTNLTKVYHGIASPITMIKDLQNSSFHNDWFTDLDQIQTVGRYHSWVVKDEGFPEELEITSKEENQLIMSLRHKKFDVQGVQFHPESVLTPNGESMIRNWLQTPLL